MVRYEAKALGGGEQLELAEGEIDEFGCVCFKDHWFGEFSELLDFGRL